MKTLALLIPRFGTLIVAVLVALATGLLVGIAYAFVAMIDGRISKAEQAEIEAMTWKPAWIALRALPWLTVD